MIGLKMPLESKKLLNNNNIKNSFFSQCCFHFYRSFTRVERSPSHNRRRGRILGRGFWYGFSVLVSCMSQKNTKTSSKSTK